MTCARVTSPSRGTSPGGLEKADDVASVLEELALLELLLREFLQLADRDRDLGRVRRREADHVLAVAVVLLQADVADVRDMDFDVRLAFDHHGQEPPSAAMVVPARAVRCAAGVRRTGYYPSTTGSRYISTRRFAWRPVSVELLSTGWVS